MGVMEIVVIAAVVFFIWYGLRVRLMLAQLYREMGRDEDAQKVEAELRALLAYADLDHPILRQLEPTTTTAFQQAAN